MREGIAGWAAHFADGMGHGQSLIPNPICLFWCIGAGVHSRRGCGFWTLSLVRPWCSVRAFHRMGLGRRCDCLIRVYAAGARIVLRGFVLIECMLIVVAKFPNISN